MAGRGLAKIRERVKHRAEKGVKNQMTQIV
jgi:hypothetical protein